MAACSPRWWRWARPGDFGFDVESDSEVRLDAFLFGEAQGRIVGHHHRGRPRGLFSTCPRQRSAIPVTLLGHTTKGKCVVDGQALWLHC